MDNDKISGARRTERISAVTRVHRALRGGYIHSEEVERKALRQMMRLRRLFNQYGAEVVYAWYGISRQELLKALLIQFGRVKAAATADFNERFSERQMAAL
jgi:hypothetical protein